MDNSKEINKLKTRINFLENRLKEFNSLKKKDNKHKNDVNEALNNFKSNVASGTIDIKKMRLLLFDMVLQFAEDDSYQYADEGEQFFLLFDLLNEL